MQETGNLKMLNSVRFSLTLLFFLGLAFCSSAINSNNEEPQINWGMPLTKTGKGEIITMLGTYREQIVLLKKEKRSLFEPGTYNLEFFTEGNYSLKESIKLPLTNNNGEELDLIEVLILPESIISFSAKLSSKQKKIDLYLSVLEEGKKVFSENSLIKSLPSPPKDEFGLNSFKICPMGDKFCIAFSNPYTETAKQIEILQINQQAQLQKNKSISLPAYYYSFEIDDLVAGNDSILFFNIRQLKEKKEYSLISFDFNQSRTNIVELEIPDMSISALQLISDNGVLFAGGYLKERKKNAAPSAYFTAGFDQSLNVIHKLSYTNFSSLKESKNNPDQDKNKEWPDLKLLKIIKVNQGLFLVGEQQRKDNVCISDFRTGFIRCNDYYYYVNVLCIFAGIEVPSWKSTIHKYQSSIDDGGIYGSVITATDRDSSILLVYNDHKKNLQKSGNEIKNMNNPSKSNCVAVSINTKGQVKKTNLYSSQEQNIILIPSFNLPKRKNEYYVFGEKGGISRIGLLSLP